LFYCHSRRRLAFLPDSGVVGGLGVFTARGLAKGGYTVFFAFIHSGLQWQGATHGKSESKKMD